MKVAEVRDLDVDELRQREKDLDDQLFRLRIQKSMGQTRGGPQAQEPSPRHGARQDRAAREGGRVGMATKEVTGVVVSNKMDKTVVVAVERQIRHDVYGKTQRRTSTFMAHDEKATPRSAIAWPSSRAGR